MASRNRGLCEMTEMISEAAIVPSTSSATMLARRCRISTQAALAAGMTAPMASACRLGSPAARSP